MNWEEYKLECYLLARYQEELRETGRFNERTTELIQAGMGFSKEGGIPFLESMISHGGAYDEMDRMHCPILIYVGDPICYGVLDGFARSLGMALSEAGQLVEFFDPNGENFSELSRFIGKRFRAIIGLQTFALSVEMKDGRNLHDLLEGPKFNMVLDHPVWFKKHLEKGPKNYYVLTHDSNYVRFIEEYFPNVKKTFLLPPGGEQAGFREGVRTGFDEGAGSTLPEGSEAEFPTEEKKDLPLTFVGSYHDWRLWKQQVREVNRETKGLAQKYLTHMRRFREETWEEGLRQVLSLPELSDHPVAKKARENREAFKELLFLIKPVCFVVMSYIREKILDVIAASGVPMHVYGDSFQNGRYAGVKSFIRHGNLSPEESLFVYARSKVSLNIMSWHKAGMTERLANMMQNGAVVVTDESKYLRENYKEGEDYVAFSLTETERIPKILQELLSDEKRRQQMAERAFRKAVKKETWSARAETFLRILEETT